MCFNNCLLGKHDAMGYVSTCGGLGWVRHDVKEGKKERTEVVDKKNNSNFSHARAFLESLVCDGCNVHVTPRIAVAKKPLDAKKRDEKKEKEREREQGTRC